MGPNKRPMKQNSICLRFEAIKCHDKIGIRCHEGLRRIFNCLPTYRRNCTVYAMNSRTNLQHGLNEERTNFCKRRVNLRGELLHCGDLGRANAQAP